jgi:O-antigen/teichoic acid export membrane protein
VPLAGIGIYSLAYKIGMAVSHVHQPFETYWRAQVFKLLKLEKGEQIYERTATYLSLVLTSVALVLVLFLDPLMNVMVGPDFREAGVYVPWIAAVYLVRAFGDYLRTIIRVEGKTGREAQVTTISALVCLAGYALLIPRYHLWGAIAATGVCFAVALVLSWRQAQRTRPFHFELRRMAVIVLSAALIAVAFRLLRPEDLWLQIPIALACLAAYPALLVASQVPNAEERELAASAASKLRRRFGGR